MNARILVRTIVIMLFWLVFAPAKADLRSSPNWFDQNAIGASPDWHYRVPINIPAGSAANATIKFDTDFTTLLSTLGVSGSFDVNSPRVVRSTGALATRQEFTDSVYAGATDATGNGRGEVRFLLEDAGATIYYLYFDITQNGAKPANPQTPINGNFEFGAIGTAIPPGWTNSTKLNALFDTQIRGSENPSITTDGATGANATVTTDGTPRTGNQSYLIGSRTNNEPAGFSNRNATLLDRTITVPAGAAAGNLTIRWRPEGWDSDANSAAGTYDHVKVSIVTASGAVTQIIGPAAGAYGTQPFAPNYGTNAITATTPGYGRYNFWDMGTNGVATHTQGMTVTPGASPWWTLNASLAAFAGQTVTLRIETAHLNQYRTWASVDDIEWSVVNATLGTPQGFGVNITAPLAGANVAAGTAIPISVQVDANPTASTNPVTAQLYDQTGNLVAGGPYILYNDGTHGDVTAGDAIWTNDGSVPAQPAPTVPATVGASIGWTLRVFGKDASTTTIGAQNGLIRGPGTGAAPQTQANFWNIDEIVFNVQTANIVATKTSEVISDPANGTTNPKLIPGAVVRYCILLNNTGAVAATAVNAVDTLPATLSYNASSLRSGANCASATTPEDDNATDGDDTDAVGASASGATITIIAPSLAGGGSIAVTLDATIL